MGHGRVQPRRRQIHRFHLPESTWLGSGRHNSGSWGLHLGESSGHSQRRIGYLPRSCSCHRKFQNVSLDASRVSAVCSKSTSVAVVGVSPPRLRGDVAKILNPACTKFLVLTANLHPSRHRHGARMGTGSEPKIARAVTGSCSVVPIACGVRLPPKGLRCKRT